MEEEHQKERKRSLWCEKVRFLYPPPASSLKIDLWRSHSILAPPRDGGLWPISLDKHEEAGLEQGEGEQGVGLMLLAEGKGEAWETLATAPLASPAPGFWPKWSKVGWLRKREEARVPPWPPEAPTIALLAPSRVERGSWPPLAARAEKKKEKRSRNERKIKLIFITFSPKFSIKV